MADIRAAESLVKADWWPKKTSEQVALGQYGQLYLLPCLVDYELKGKQCSGPKGGAG